MDVAKRVREALSSGTDARRRREAEKREALRLSNEEAQARARTEAEELRERRRAALLLQKERKQQGQRLRVLLKQFKRAAFPKVRVAISRGWILPKVRVEFRRWWFSEVWAFEIDPVLTGQEWTFTISSPIVIGYRTFPRQEGLTADGVIDYLAARASEILDPATDTSRLVLPPPPETPPKTSSSDDSWVRGIYAVITFIVAFLIWVIGMFVAGDKGGVIGFLAWFFLGWIPAYLVAFLWPIAALIIAWGFLWGG